MEDIYFLEVEPSTGKVLKQPSKLVGRHVGANMGPVFSPDGKQLAYHIQRAPDIMSPGAVNLVVRSLRTGEEREIRTRVIEWGHVRWFPDGKSVLVPALRSQKDRSVDYYRIEIESAEIQLIRQSGPKHFSSSYHPDLTTSGKSIFFTEADRNDPEKTLVRFKRFDIETRKETLVHQLPRGTRAMSIQLSPDEKTVAWVEWAQGPPSWTLNTRSLEDGTTREILRLEQPETLQDSSIVWVPDGQHFLVSKSTGKGRSELLRLSLNGDEPSTLGISMERIVFGDIHKNGSLVAFSTGQPKGKAKEIWALEGFLSEEGASE